MIVALCASGLSLILTAFVKVTGVDIYFGKSNGHNEEERDGRDEQPIQRAAQLYEPYRWNLNASFKGDPSDNCLVPRTFDLINSRMLMDGINANRWPIYIKELWYLLKRGGWLQMVELELRFQSDSGLAPVDNTNPLFRWQTLYYAAMEQMGKDPRVGGRLGALMSQAGFQNIIYQRHQLRIGPWNESELQATTKKPTPIC